MAAEVRIDIVTRSEDADQPYAPASAPAAPAPLPAAQPAPMPAPPPPAPVPAAIQDKEPQTALAEETKPLHMVADLAAKEQHVQEEEHIDQERLAQDLLAEDRAKARDIARTTDSIKALEQKLAASEQKGSAGEAQVVQERLVQEKEKLTELVQEPAQQRPEAAEPRQPVPAVTQGGKETVPEPAPKEQWEMTRAEHRQYAEPATDHPEGGYRIPGDEGEWFRDRAQADQFLDGEHKAWVQHALEDGKPVPADVVADYPDLVQQYPPVQLPDPLPGRVPSLPAQQAPGPVQMPTPLAAQAPDLLPGRPPAPVQIPEPLHAREVLPDQMPAPIAVPVPDMPAAARPAPMPEPPVARETAAVPSPSVQAQQREPAYSESAPVPTLPEQQARGVSETSAPQTEAFKEWFGDWKNDPANASKAVNEDGTPTTVHHGSPESFSAFDKSKIGGTDTGWYGAGFYHNTDKDIAAQYARGSGNVKQSHLNVRNPLRIGPEYGLVEGELADMLREVLPKGYVDHFIKEKTSIPEIITKHLGPDKFTELAKSKGYDGILKNHSKEVVGHDSQEWVTFDPEQIKPASSATSDRPMVEQAPADAADLPAEPTPQPLPVDRSLEANDPAPAYSESPEPSPAGPQPAPVGMADLPSKPALHQMTKSDWYSDDRSFETEEPALAHRAAVEQAVKSGQKVSREVLHDYPDLEQQVPRWHVTAQADKIREEGFKADGSKGVGGAVAGQGVSLWKEERDADELLKSMRELESVRTSETPTADAVKLAGQPLEYTDKIAQMNAERLNRPLTERERAVTHVQSTKHPYVPADSFFHDEPARTFEKMKVGIAPGAKSKMSDDSEELYDPAHVFPLQPDRFEQKPTAPAECESPQSVRADLPSAPAVTLTDEQTSAERAEPTVADTSDALPSMPDEPAQPGPAPLAETPPSPVAQADAPGGLFSDEAPLEPAGVTDAPIKLDHAPESPIPNRVYSVPLKDIHRDPERFQYKMATNKKGVTDKYSGVPFMQKFAGVLGVWKDPEDGKTYVVEGHHRLEMAERTPGIETLDVKYMDAPTVERAKAEGALSNIAGGQGTAMDAGKFMRETGKTSKEDFRKEGVSLKSDVASKGLVLSQLEPSLFEKVARGQMEEDTALSIGKHLKLHSSQIKLAEILRKKEESGKRYAPKVIEEMAKEMAATPSKKTTEQGLFGDMASYESLFADKNELKTAVRGDFAKNLNDFKVLSSERRAENVSSAGNKIDVDANKRIADEQSEILAVFDKLVNRKGPIANVMNEGAADWAKARTGTEKSAVREKALAAVSAAVKQELANPTAAFAASKPGVAPSPSLAAPDETDEPEPAPPTSMKEFATQHGAKLDKLYSQYTEAKERHENLETSAEADPHLTAQADAARKRYETIAQKINVAEKEEYTPPASETVAETVTETKPHVSTATAVADDGGPQPVERGPATTEARAAQGTPDPAVRRDRESDVASDEKPASRDWFKGLVEGNESGNAHVLIEGESGSGKSTLTKKLAFERMQQGQDVHVVDTHNPEAWGGAKNVFQGRDAGAESAIFMRKELDSRKAESSRAKLAGEEPNYKQMTVVFSDFARLMKDSPELQKEFRTILTEARKFKMSVVADTTRFTGAESGMKGIENVRANFGQKVQVFPPGPGGEGRTAKMGGEVFPLPEMGTFAERRDIGLIKPEQVETSPEVLKRRAEMQLEKEAEATAQKKTTEQVRREIDPEYAAKAVERESREKNAEENRQLTEEARKEKLAVAKMSPEERVEHLAKKEVERVTETNAVKERVEEQRRAQDPEYRAQEELKDEYRETAKALRELTEAARVEKLRLSQMSPEERVEHLAAKEAERVQEAKAVKERAKQLLGEEAPAKQEFDPHVEAEKKREKAVQQEQVKAAYEEKYGDPADKPKSGIDAGLDLAQQMRGTLGGAFGPMAGAVLDLVTAVRKAQAPAKTELRKEAERRNAEMAEQAQMEREPEAAEPATDIAERIVTDTTAELPRQIADEMPVDAATERAETAQGEPAESARPSAGDNEPARSARAEQPTEQAPAESEALELPELDFSQELDTSEIPVAERMPESPDVAERAPSIDMPTAQQPPAPRPASAPVNSPSVASAKPTPAAAAGNASANAAARGATAASSGGGAAAGGASGAAGAATSAAGAGGAGAGAAAGGAAAMAAAAGPAAVVVAAVVAVQALRDAAMGAVAGLGDAGASLASFKDGSARVHEMGAGMKGFSEKLFYVNPIMGVLGSVAGEAVSSVAKLDDAVKASADRLAQYSGELAAQKAQQDVAVIMRDIDRAQRMGGAVAGANDARFNMEQKLQNITDKFIPYIMKIAEEIFKVLNGLFTVVDGIMTVLGPAVDAVAPIATAAAKVASFAHPIGIIVGLLRDIGERDRAAAIDAGWNMFLNASNPGLVPTPIPMAPAPGPAVMAPF